MLIPIFLFLHLLIVFLVLKEEKKGKLFLNPFLLVLLCMFPVLGVITVLAINLENAKAESRQELSFEEVIPWLSDEAFDGEMDTKGATDMEVKEIIPFQEALLLNHASIKRALIIDLIFEKPDQFVPLLHQARLNDDIEVVHYATTILSELTAKYDTKLHSLEKKMRQDPDSLQAKKAYISFLQQYMDSQLAEGYYENTLRHRYAELVSRLQKENIMLEKSCFVRLGEMYLKFQDMQRFSKLLNQMQQLFPEEEETWMLRLKAIVTWKSQQELSDFFHELKENHIYLSAKNREFLAVWQQEREENV
ncbi:hypothetical protein [Streptococcus sp. Marseille-P7376]|uniref:hypothetical protein n=1 Tax=Streptococcus sp. Marseille-P7376 TaxID=2592044 RepID=UPI0011E7422A|nr:hypothetical protein [Streptococcus sp. Marseille-P7376]